MVGFCDEGMVSFQKRPRNPALTCHFCVFEIDGVKWGCQKKTFPTIEAFLDTWFLGAEQRSQGHHIRWPPMGTGIPVSAVPAIGRYFR